MREQLIEDHREGVDVSRAAVPLVPYHLVRGRVRVRVRVRVRARARARARVRLRARGSSTSQAPRHSATAAPAPAPPAAEVWRPGRPARPCRW